MNVTSNLYLLVVIVEKMCNLLPYNYNSCLATALWLYPLIPLLSYSTVSLREVLNGDQVCTQELKQRQHANIS